MSAGEEVIRRSDAAARDPEVGAFRVAARDRRRLSARFFRVV